jgi:hypothetical protein
MTMTAQPLTAHMIVLAIDMEDVAGEIRALGTDEAKQHAVELEAAAATVRQWAQACEAVPA